jgi:HAD superfamily hydrolase (TIGR01484 family)
MIKLVAMDFDLTMFDYKRPADTRVLLGWFEALTKAGVMVGTASGRTAASLRHEIEAIGMAWNRPFPSFTIVEEGVILTHEGVAWPGLATRNEDRGAQIYEGNLRLRPLFELGVDWALKEGIPLERRIETGAHGINVVFNTPENAERVRRRMMTELPGEEFNLVRNHHIVIGLPVGCAKGDAVSDLAQALKVPAIQTLVIGDNLNDLCMFEAAHGFQTATVGNGLPEVKAAVAGRAGYVARGEIAFGVAEVFERYFEELAQEVKGIGLENGAVATG